jgi:carboxymethylenebutenolidase
VEVQVEIAVPAGKGPFPGLLFMPACRDHDEADRRYSADLAVQCFLVAAPDW